MTLVILGIVAGFLFLLAYTAKRRFGVLGLGLAAGTVLARSVGVPLGDYVRTSDLPVSPLSYDTFAMVLLTLLPALLMLAGGPAYTSKRAAIIGSVLFAVLATLIILGPLTINLPIIDPGVRQVLTATAQWQDYIIAGGIGIAVGDMLLMRLQGGGEKKVKH